MRASASGQGQCRYEALEQCDEPLAGHSDSGDNGQGNKPGDETVFDCGGAGLVTQKLSKHFNLSRALTNMVWHAQVAIKKTKSVKLQIYWRCNPKLRCDSIRFGRGFVFQTDVFADPERRVISVIPHT